MFLSRHDPPLPELGRHVENALDQQLRAFRKAELVYIREEATRLRTEATDVNEAMSEVENILALIRNMAVEVAYVIHMPELGKNVSKTLFLFLFLR